MIRVREILSHSPCFSPSCVRARKHGIHYNELFCALTTVFRTSRIVSLVHFEECPRRRIILARMRGLQTAVDKLYGRAVRVISYEPLYAISSCEGSRLFVCISERFATHTMFKTLGVRYRTIPSTMRLAQTRISLDQFSRLISLIKRCNNKQFILKCEKKINTILFIK